MTSLSRVHALSRSDSQRRIRMIQLQELEDFNNRRIILLARLINDAVDYFPETVAVLETLLQASTARREAINAAIEALL